MENRLIFFIISIFISIFVFIIAFVILIVLSFLFFGEKARIKIEMGFFSMLFVIGIIITTFTIIVSTTNISFVKDNVSAKATITNINHERKVIKNSVHLNEREYIYYTKVDYEYLVNGTLYKGTSGDIDRFMSIVLGYNGIGKKVNINYKINNPSVSYLTNFSILGAIPSLLIGIAMITGTFKRLNTLYKRLREIKVYDQKQAKGKVQK